MPYPCIQFGVRHTRNLLNLSEEDMTGKLGFYLWLIETLRDKRMTLAEIKERWSLSSHNVGQIELTDRTFHRYRENIGMELGVHIECNKKAGNLYYIHSSLYDNSQMVDWLLSAFQISSMGQRMQQHEKIMLEEPPQNTLVLNDILDAIDSKHYVQCDYVSVYGIESLYTLAPLFVRLFRQRWYVVGMLKGSDEIKILAANRINHFRILKEKIKKETSLLPEVFFKDCFGIINLKDKMPETIRLRAFWPQYVFIEEMPLHHSQRMVKDSGDGEYKEFELFVQPTFDFKQELLRNGRGLIVLSPLWFKEEMMAILTDMTKSYKTGEDYSGEGLGDDAKELPEHD